MFSSNKKFIFPDGVMQLNPYYVPDNKFESTKRTVADPKQALTILSSTTDIQTASEAKKLERPNEGPIKISDGTVKSMEMIQSDYYLEEFKKPGIDGGELLENLSNFFSKYEVPIGLVNKIQALLEFKKLDIIVDDSSSMDYGKSDVFMQDATPYVQEVRDSKGQRRRNNEKMTRWEEAEDRLHTMIDMLAYIPCPPIKISYLNDKSEFNLAHTGKTPDEFRKEAHAKITAEFNRKPRWSTPIYAKLEKAFNTREKTAYYLFTDGQPDETTDSIVKLVKERPNPENHPITIISCTDNGEEVEWIKSFESDPDAKNVSEVDDFKSERDEVRKNQGPVFPYTKGMWLICQLVSGIDKQLDNIDDPKPMSKKSMDNLLGIIYHPNNYKRYFNHFASTKYAQLYSQYSKGDLTTEEIERNNPWLFSSPSSSSSSSYTLSYAPPSSSQAFGYSLTGPSQPYGHDTQIPPQSYGYGPQASSQAQGHAYGSSQQGEPQTYGYTQQSSSQTYSRLYQPSPSQPSGPSQSYSPEGYSQRYDQDQPGLPKRHW